MIRKEKNKKKEESLFWQNTLQTGNGSLAVQASKLGVKVPKQSMLKSSTPTQVMPKSKYQHPSQPGPAQICLLPQLPVQKKQDLKRKSSAKKHGYSLFPKPHKSEIPLKKPKFAHFPPSK